MHKNYEGTIKDGSLLVLGIKNGNLNGKTITVKTKLNTRGPVLSLVGTLSSNESRTD